MHIQQLYQVHMDFKFNVIDFGQQEDNYLRQILLAESNEASLILQTIHCPADQFQECLACLVIKRNYFANILSKKVTGLSLMRIFFKLNSWTPTVIQDSKSLCSNLFALEDCYSSASDSFSKKELIVYLSHKIPDIFVVYQFLEQIFIKECFQFSQSEEDIKKSQKMKEFLQQTYTKITKGSSEEENIELGLLKLTEIQKVELQARTIKLFSRIFCWDPLTDFDLDRLFNYLEKSSTAVLLEQILQINCQKSRNLIRLISETKLDQEQNEKIWGEAKIVKTMLTNELVDHVLSTSSERYDCLQTDLVNEEQKIIVFSYNVVQLSETVFSNFLPHRLKHEKEDRNYENQDLTTSFDVQIFMIFNNVICSVEEIGKKLSEGWVFKAKKYQNGKTVLVEYQRQQRVLLVERCMLLFENVLRMAYGMKKNLGKYKCKYVSMDSFIQGKSMSYKNLRSLFTLFIGPEATEQLSVKTIDTVCSIFLTLSHLGPNRFQKIIKQQQFFINFINKMMEMLKKTPVDEQIRHVIHFTYDLDDLKDSTGLSPQTHPFNFPSISEVVFDTYFMRDPNGIITDRIIGPCFVGMGRYSEENDNYYLDRKMIARYPRFAEYLQGKFPTVLDSIQLNDTKTISPIEESRITLLLTLFLSESYCQRVSQIMRRPGFKVPTYCKSQLAKVLSVDVQQEIRGSAIKMIELLREVSKAQFDIPDLCVRLQCLPQLLQTLLSESRHLKLFFDVGYNAMKGKIGAAPQLIQLLFHLSEVRYQINEQVILFFAQKSQQELGKHLQEMDKMNVCNRPMYDDLEQMLNLFQFIINFIIDYLQSIDSFSFIELIPSFEFMFQPLKGKRYAWRAGCLNMLSRIVDKNGIGSSRGKVGLVFLTYFKKQVKELIFDIYSSRPDNLQSFNVYDLNDLYTLLQSFIQDKKMNKSCSDKYARYLRCQSQEQVQSFFTEVVNIKNSENIYVNHQIYRGHRKYSKILKSFLNMILYSALEDFQLQLMPFYDFISKIFCDKISSLDKQAYSNTTHSQTPSNISLVYQDFTILDEDDCDETLSKTKFQFIFRLTQLDRNNSMRNQIQQTVETLFKSITNKQFFQQEIKALLSAVISNLESELEKEIIEMEVFTDNFSMLNVLALQTDDLNIGQVLPIKLINKLLERFRTLLQENKKKEHARVYFKLLEKLLPSKYPSEEGEVRQKIVRYAKYLAQLILAAIAHLQQTINDCELECESIVCKLAKSKQADLEKYAAQIADNLKLSKCSDLVCQIFSQKDQRVNMQLQIKAFFLKQMERRQFATAEADLNDLVFEFKDRYKDKKAEFTDVAKDFTKIYSKQGDKTNLRIIYASPEQLSYSKYLDSEFINFKPSVILRNILKRNIEALVEDITARGVITQLIKILHNYPIVLPFISFHPVQTKDKLQPFLDFIIEQELFADNQDLRLFLIFACLDQSSIIKGQNRSILFSDYVCYYIVRKLSELPQLTNKALLLILFLSQINKFSRYCHLKFKRKQSLKEKVEETWSKSAPENKQRVSRRLICSFAVTFLNRIFLFQKLRFKTSILSKKNKEKFILIESCGLSSLGIVTKLSPEETIAKSDLFSIDEKQMLQNLEAVEKNIEMLLSSLDFGQSVVEDISAAEIDPDILQSLEFKKLKVSQFQEWKDIDAIRSCRFNSVVWNIYKYTVKNHNLQLRNTTAFSPRFQEESEENKRLWSQEAAILVDTIEPSRYAPLDYTHSHRTEEKSAQESFQQAIVSQIQHCVKDYFVNKSEKTQEQSKQIQTNTPNKQFLNTEQVKKLIGSIDSKRRTLGQPQFDVRELLHKNEIEIIDQLMARELQSDFDLKEATLPIDMFQEYCLSNLTKLERLESGRRNKVMRLQEEIIQMYVRRTTSSDSVDYVIDTIDENYQLLSNISRSKSEAVPKKKDDDKMMLQREVRGSQIPIQVFPDIDEETLFQFISLLYLQIKDFKFQNFTAFLENKKVQTKILNTLLYIMRNPLQNELFPHHLFNVSSLTQQTSPDAAAKIQKTIIQFICSYYQYSFYRDEDYLFQRTDGKGIKGIELKSLGLLDNGEKQKPIYDIIMYALDEKIGGIQNSLKLRLLKGLRYVPAIVIDRIMEFITSFNEELNNNEENDDEDLFKNDFEYTDLKKEFKIPQNLGQLSKNQQFAKRIKELSPPEKPTLNSFILASFIELGIYSDEEYKLMHQMILKKEDKKVSCLFFCNQVIKVYTDEELKTALWMEENIGLYQTMYKKYAEKSKCIQQENCYRLFFFSNLVKSFSLELKMEILASEIQGVKKQSGLDYIQCQILAKRKKGIFESAFEDFRYKPTEFWLSQFSVRFANENEEIQSGHGDGVEKEWYTLVTRGMVNLDFGLFRKSSSHYYFFNRESWVNPRHLQFLQFIGKLFALAVTRSNYFLTPAFALPLYRLLVGEQITVEDLLDEFDEGQMVRGLNQLRTFTDDSQFWQTFVYEDVRLLAGREVKEMREGPEEGENMYLMREAHTLRENEDAEQPQKIVKVLKVGEAVELLPGGAQIPVTLQNVEQYIQLTKKKILDSVIGSVSKQAKAFVGGFTKVIDPKYLKKFSAEELRMIAEGSKSIDIAELRKNVTLIRYEEADSNLQMFWKFFSELSPEDQGHFMQHWTGTPKLPAEGLKEMSLAIVRGNDTKRMFAQTCFNKLSLPKFQKEEEMKEAMMMAINSVKLNLSILQD